MTETSFKQYMVDDAYEVFDLLKAWRRSYIDFLFDDESNARDHEVAIELRVKLDTALRFVNEVAETASLLKEVLDAERDE